MPAGEPVIRQFTTWPKDWDADFRLLARRAFWVASAQHDGEVPFVEIESLSGQSCRVESPWSDKQVTLARSGVKTDELSGKLLEFSTSAGEQVTLYPAGARPQAILVPGE